MVAHVCIWFLAISLVMVYFTSTGSPQAGLLEVGVSALIFVNYHYLKVVKKDASLEQLLVGDLLVHKIVKTIKKEPIALVTKEEIPKTVSESIYEKPAPAISPDHLKTTIADTIKSDTSLELLHVTPHAPVMKTRIAVIAENTVLLHVSLVFPFILALPGRTVLPA